MFVLSTLDPPLLTFPRLVRWQRARATEAAEHDREQDEQDGQFGRQGQPANAAPSFESSDNHRITSVS